MAKDKHLGQAFEINDSKGKWYGQELGVESEPLIDSGTGKAVIIRVFKFQKNPEFKGQMTKQELFNLHWRQIKTMLWGDGLIPKDEIEPRVMLGKKGYTIFITCEARSSTFVAEKPDTLQSLLKKK